MRFPRCQFSLKVMILIVALMSAIIGIYVLLRTESLNQHRQVELLVEQGGGFYVNTDSSDRIGAILGFDYPADQIRLIKGSERADWGMTPGWQCDDNDLKLLRPFRNLEELYISGSTLSNTGWHELCKLPKLKLIQCRNCDLMQCDLSALANNSALHRLDLHGCKIDHSTVEKLRTRNPELEIRGIAR